METQVGSPAWGWYEHSGEMGSPDVHMAHSSLHFGLCTRSLHLPSLATLSTVVPLILFLCFILSITHINAWHIYTDLCIIVCLSQ